MPKSRLTRGLRDQIAIELRTDIVSGRFTPGMQMVERQLAQRFGVSHAPIREALLQLSHEGLLVSQTNRGAQVAPPLDPAIRRFFMVLRTSLETYALRLSFAELTPAELNAWQGTVDRCQHARDAGNSAVAAEEDFNFHQTIVCRAGQSDVVAAWRTVVSRARVYANEWAGVNSRPIDAQSDHATIVAHCRTGDVEAAVRVLENNVRNEMEAIPEPAVSLPTA